MAYCDVQAMHETNARVAAAGGDSFAMTVDIGVAAQRRAFRDATLEAMGHVDVLINNAGIALGERTFEEVDEADFEKITEINYWGVVHTTKLFYDALLSRPAAAIANLSSTQGILGVPFLVPYCTTKFAVRGFTDALRAEHHFRGIDHVSLHAIHPGAVATDITPSHTHHVVSAIARWTGTVKR